MGFKIIKQEIKKNITLSNKEFLNFLLEHHNSILRLRSLNIDLDNNSIPTPVEEKNKNFDFFKDEKKDLAREQAIFDIENSIIDKKEIHNESQNEIIDRRKRKRK
jgi:hypothetical protein